MAILKRRGGAQEKPAHAARPVRKIAYADFSKNLPLHSSCSFEVAMHELGAMRFR